MSPRGQVLSLITPDIYPNIAPGKLALNCSVIGAAVRLKNKSSLDHVREKIKEVFFGPSNVGYFILGNIELFPVWFPMSKTIYLAYQGSKDVMDWMINAQFCFRQMSGGVGRIHSGFDYANVNYNHEHILTIQNRINRFQPHHIVFTGHSQGGAMAQLGAIKLSQVLGEKITVCTTGSPCIGDDRFATWAESQINHIRIQNDFDIITNINRWQGRHAVETLVHLQGEDRLVTTKDKSLPSTGGLAFPWLRPSAVKAHSPFEYERKLRKAHGILN